MDEWKITIFGSKTDNKKTKTELELELDDDFMEWFKTNHDLARWSDKKFRSWFSETMRTLLVSLAKQDTPEPKAHECIYNRKTGYGSLEDIQPGDLVDFFEKGGPQFTREVKKVLKSGVSTEPIIEGKPGKTVRFIDIAEIQRKI